MDDKFLIHLDIAEKSYGLWIDRKDEQLARDAAKQIRNKINQYRQNFAQSDVDVKDLLAMVAFQLSMTNLQLEDKNDTSPITDKIQELTGELEQYLKDNGCNQTSMRCLCVISPGTSTQKTECKSI